MIRYGIIGSGWRSEFYIRIAKLVPDKFSVTAVLIRDKEKGNDYQERFGIKVVNTLDELAGLDMDFVVLSIKRGITSEYLPELFERKIPVLCETPPGETVEALSGLWEQYKKYQPKIQIAEQYFLQPLYASWIKVIADGKLGEVQNVNISSLHGYHGVSMIRKILGISYENCKIYGKRFFFDVTETSGRDGIVYDGETFQCARDRITFEFENGKVAFFDFSDPAQYHSFIRTRQLNVQGIRGEIDDLAIRYLTKDNIPVTQEFNRIDLGLYNNQEWSHFGIMLGEEVLYQSPFKNARLNDDEIAVASCLLGMDHYIKTGEDFYSLREALQDMYLCVLMDKAVEKPNTEIISKTQIWV